MGESGMTNLERRYRRLLKVLPKWYRQDREEEMVGLFLAERHDDRDLEHGWPGWGETASILGLATRTHLAAGVVFTNGPTKAVWRGEVVRALGMLGLLVAVFYAGSSITSLSVAYANPAWAPEITWVRFFDLAPIVAFVALLAGKRTLAKVAAGLAVVPVVVGLGEPRYILLWTVFQVPLVITFVCLCLGFHREAPTPPPNRLAWWGGGALVLGLVGGFASGIGLLAITLISVIVRIVAFVRGDVVLGRALSVFAVLMLVPIAFLVQGEVAGIAIGLAVLLVISAVAPIRRPSKPGFQPS